MSHTAPEFAHAAAEHEITWWPLRGCSFCAVPIGYSFVGGQVYWEGACGCGPGGGAEPRTWEDVANHFNMQTSDEVIARYSAFWHFDEPAVP